MKLFVKLNFGSLCNTKHKRNIDIQKAHKPGAIEMRIDFWSRDLPNNFDNVSIEFNNIFKKLADDCKHSTA